MPHLAPAASAPARRADASASAARKAETPETWRPREGVPSGGGAPLEASARGFMEARFGHDFGRVRVHTGPEASASAARLGAAAYAAGPHLVFREGAYAPSTVEGRLLLAHELAHVVQQERGGRASAGEPRVGPEDGPHEREARRAVEDVARGGPARVEGLSGPALQRAPGDVTSVNRYHLVLFLSQYEDDPRVPPEARRRYLLEPNLLGMAQALRDQVRANRTAGRPPLTLEDLMRLATGITAHQGTALLLCHNVTRGFARGSTALGLAPMSRGDFYAHFSPASFGTTDPGDWYHYFVLALPAFYGASSTMTDEQPTDAELAAEGAPMGTGMQRGVTVGSHQMVREAMRDPAIPPSPAYDGWLQANALSFLEGGFYGVDQAEVSGESRTHLRGARDGVLRAGGATDPRWKWHVPIVRGIGDARNPDANRILENLGRIRDGHVEDFTYDVFRPDGSLLAHLHDAVPAPPARPDSGAPANPVPPPAAGGGGGGGGILRRAPAGPGAPTAFPPGFALPRDGGAPLDPATRRDMETSLGWGFADVRVHAEGEAARSAQRIGARAYAVGPRVVFAPGLYAPRSPEGRRLLAHELVHVLQARREPRPAVPLSLAPPGGTAEAEAERLARDAVPDSRRAPVGGPRDDEGRRAP